MIDEFIIAQAWFCGQASLMLPRWHCTAKALLPVYSLLSHALAGLFEEMRSKNNVEIVN